MSIQKNINNLLDDSFKNNNFLPKKLLLEDIDRGVRDYIKGLNLSLDDEYGKVLNTPVIFLSQERWAEFKLNWKGLTDESGEEIVMPFITITRNSVKQGTSPLKRTIPNKRKFTYQQIPIFDGTVKGYQLVKIPQPVWVDVEYELNFLGHYMQDVNVFYQKMIMDGFSDLQGYMKINGYYIPMKMGDPSEANTHDQINSDRYFQISVPLTVYGRLVDPNNFEKVKTITRVSIDINELPNNSQGS